MPCCIDSLRCVACRAGAPGTAVPTILLSLEALQHTSHMLSHMSSHMSSHMLSHMLLCPETQGVAVDDTLDTSTTLLNDTLDTSTTLLSHRQPC